MEKETVDFSETVILIDSAQINKITSAKRVFEQMTNRPLKDVDIDAMLEYFALDGGVRAGDNEVQVIFIYDNDNKSLINCKPSDLEKNLNEVGYRSNLGEFLITSFSTGDVAVRQELYIETVKMLFESERAQRLILIPFMDEYKADIISICEENKGKKEVTVLQVSDSDRSDAYKSEILLFPIMQAMGIEGNEI